MTTEYLPLALADWPACANCNTLMTLTAVPWPAGGYLLRWLCLAAGPSCGGPVLASAMPTLLRAAPMPELVSDPGGVPVANGAGFRWLLGAVRFAARGLESYLDGSDLDDGAVEPVLYVEDLHGAADWLSSRMRSAGLLGPDEPEPVPSSRAELNQTGTSSPERSEGPV